MKVAELRQAILQAAVQGKLVPQNPQDEPASELLKRIQQEKARLIKEGKLKKEKPLPPVTEDEILYDLPEGWVWCRLFDVAINVDYGTSEKSHKATSEQDVPVLRMGNLQNGQIVYNNLKYIPYEKLDLPFLYLKSGDLLFNRTNSLELVGKSAIYNLQSDKYSFASYLIRVRFCKVFPAYISMYINSPHCCFEQIRPNATQQNGQANFNGTKLKHLLIPLPTLYEQERIINKVSKLMLLCDKLEAEEKKLDAMETHFAEYLPKAILQAATQGKLVPQNSHDDPASELLKRIQQEKVQLVKEGKLKKEKPLSPISEEEIPYDLPEGWVWCKLGVLADLKIGKTPARAEEKYWAEGKYPWVSIRDMETGKHINSTRESVSLIAYNDIFKGELVPSGSLLFSFKLSIGKVSVLDIDAFTNEAICAITPYGYDEVKTYLFKILPVLNLLSEANDAIKGQTLNKRSLSQIMVPLPPLEEQQRIVEKVDELMTLCDELKAAYKIPVVPSSHNNIIPFPTTQKEEETLLAARGDVGQLSNEAMQAIDDLFAEDEE